jgi:tRNA dimethylallyltransferase
LDVGGEEDPVEADSGVGRVIGLLGPTGVGKTAVAVELARMLGARVVSCDSMQLYAGFPVLTNHPSDEEGKGTHELVGLVDPGESLSAAAYAEMARPIIERQLKDCGWAVVAGGSGLYMRAALAPLAVPGTADMDVRRRLEQRAQKEGGGQLYAELVRVDAEAARSIDPHNLRRVVRALESVLVSGKAWSGRGDLWEPRYYRPTVIVGLTTDRDSLARRIEERTRMMVGKGAIDEVRRYLVERGEERTRPGAPGICSAIGYAEIYAYLKGEIGEARMIEEILAATRNYARRQLTWLRKVKDAVMIDVQGRDAPAIAKDVLESATRRASNKGSSDA